MISPSPASSDLVEHISAQSGNLPLAFDTEPGPETAAAVHDREIRVVEQRCPRVLDLGLTPARPGQTVIIALVRAGPRTLREHVEIGLMGHMRLEPLRRLAAIAEREAATIHLAKNVLCRGQVVLHVNVLEHLIGEAKLLGHQVYDFETVL